MSVLQEKVDNFYGKVFSEVNKKSFEIATLWLSIIGFFIHLFLIYAKKFSLLNLPIESGLLDNPISAIYTPFTIILIYEIYLLVLNLPRSFTTSVSKQFEIISLILIRRIFADIPKIDLEADWLTTAANVQLIYDVLGVLIMYYLIYLFNKSRLKLDKKPMTPSISRFVSSKKAVSIILLVILIIISFTSVINWIQEISNNNLTTDINSIFYNDFFSVLILADVLILLLSFQYTERYSQIVRNTGFIICTILIRLSFGVTGLTNIILIISSVIFGLLILSIYNLIEISAKEKIKR
ncbi:MAG: hypothetical protein L7S44_00925 [Flavobacteriaceae bacterium]|nr:hypothetical protein [Flavobacteriaceae bacterium]